MPSPAFETLDAVRPTPAAPASCRLALEAYEGADWIELSGEPQTIGGGPRCTVRLDAPGLKPLHCVITPTDGGAVARRWADQTELNGQPFDEAALSAGDLLRIGAVNLRVVAMPGQLPESPEPVAPPVDTSHENGGALSSDFESSDFESPVAESPVAESPEPAADAEEGWFSNSLELFQAAEDALASGDGAAEFDPAIPSRLLKPWAPERLSTPVDAEAVAPLQEEPPFAPAELSAEQAPDGPWSVVAEPEVAAPSPTFDDAAAAAFAGGPLAPFSDEEAAAEEAVAGEPASAEVISWVPLEPATDEPAAAEPLAVELVAEESCDESTSAAPEAALPTAERRRPEAARGRVRRLVDALRREREQIGVWAEACAERDSLIAALQARLDEALLAVKVAGDELLRRSGELTEAAPSVFSDLDLDPAPVEGPAATAEAPSWGVAAEIEEPLAEPVWEAYDHQRDAADMATASPWSVAEEVGPASTEPTVTEGESPSITFPEVGLHETKTVAEDGLMWGIERLADEAPPEPVAALWDQAPVQEESPGVEPEAAYLGEPSEEIDAFQGPETGDAVVELGEPAEAPTEAAAEEPFVESSEAEAAPYEAPASFIEPFAHLVPDEVEPVEEVEAVAPQATAPAAKASGDEEDSIDEYMRKLMDRVRGGGEPSAPSSQAPAKPAAAPAPAAVAATVALPAQAAEAVPAQAPIRDLSEIRRSPSPAAKTDLGALRQLANQSARSAIDVANTRVSRERASLRLVVSAVVLGCGVLAAVTASSPFDVQFGAGIAGGAAGCWLGVRTLRSCQSASTKAEYDALAGAADS